MGTGINVGKGAGVIVGNKDAFIGDVCSPRDGPHAVSETMNTNKETEARRVQDVLGFRKIVRIGDGWICDPFVSRLDQRIIAQECTIQQMRARILEGGT